MVVGGLFLLPGLFTVTTLDGTRVFVCVVAAAALFVVHEQLHTIKHGDIAASLPSPVRWVRTQATWRPSQGWW